MVNLQTFISNLKRAIANGEIVSIGGGEFTPDELLKIWTEIQQLIIAVEVTE